MGEEQKEEQPGLGEQAKALREDMSPSKLNEKLEEVIEERPKTAHVLDFAIVGRALLAAAVIAVILGLLIGWPIAAIALVVVFFGGWLLGAQLSYDRRRPTRDASDDEEEEEEKKKETAASGKDDEDEDEYEADRGEVEAEQEQEGKDKKAASR
jgi:flagellar biosynthesis component FlhA